MVMKMKANAARRTRVGGGALVEITREMKQWSELVASLGKMM
jgi:hypothetical protein